MKNGIRGAFLLAALVASYQVIAAASGSRLPSASEPAKTPEERAVESYNSGIEHKDRGFKYGQEAASKQGADAEKLTKKAHGEFEKALKDFESASKSNPQLFQAYNGMGFAYRKTGDYTNALAMYDKAIGMAGGFYSEAIEYRAEAYLALNRIDDAKKAYMDLFAADRKQADLLMTAMKEWVAKRQADAAGLDGAVVDGFSKWVSERGEIGKETEPMALSSSHSRW